MFKKRIPYIGAVGAAILLMAAGIIACNGQEATPTPADSGQGATSTPADSGRDATPTPADSGRDATSTAADNPVEAWIDTLSPSEQTCLDRLPNIREAEGLQDLTNSVDSGDEQSFADAMRLNSTVWDECVDPKNDVRFLLFVLQYTFGSLSPETESCLRGTLENFELSESQIGREAGFASRWVAIVGTLELAEDCVTEAEEREGEVRLFAKQIAGGRLTDQEMDCVRQAAIDDGGPFPALFDPATFRGMDHGAVLLMVHSPAVMDHPAFDCITPERFGELATVDWGEGVSISLHDNQLGCIADLFADMYSTYLELGRDPNRSWSSFRANFSQFFSAAITFTCFTSDQLLPVLGPTNGDAELGADELECARETYEMLVDDYREYGWEIVLGDMDDLTDHEREVREVREERLESICPDMRLAP